VSSGLTGEVPLAVAVLVKSDVAPVSQGPRRRAAGHELTLA